MGGGGRGLWRGLGGERGGRGEGGTCREWNWRIRSGFVDEGQM